MWTSKLGNKYPMDSMQHSDQAAQKELKRMRTLRTNSLCFDCGSQDNTWSSVNHGVFICMVCSDVHRSVGTHITKVKGCTGTYLWGPDELELMRSIGNQGGEDRYGKVKVSPDASKEKKQQHVVEKYEKRLFVDRPALASQHANSVVQKVEVTQHPTLPSEPCGLVAKKQRSEFEKKAPSPSKAEEISQSFFDELFSEVHETRLVDEVVVAKAGDIAIKSDSKQSSNLDDFFGSMFCAESKAPTTRNSTLHTRLNQGIEITGRFDEDPFFDWAL